MKICAEQIDFEKIEYLPYGDNLERQTVTTKK